MKDCFAIQMVIWAGRTQKSNDLVLGAYKDQFILTDVKVCLVGVSMRNDGCFGVNYYILKTWMVATE